MFFANFFVSSSLFHSWLAIAIAKTIQSIELNGFAIVGLLFRVLSLKVVHDSSKSCGIYLRKNNIKAE